MIQGVIFDLGGTLLQSHFDGQWDLAFPRMDADLLAALEVLGYALDSETFTQRFGAIFTALDAQCQADWREVTAAQVLSQTLADLGAPPLSPADQAQALRAYYAYTESIWRPMPGVYEVLPQLLAAGRKLAIISNANDSDNAERLIDAVNLRGYFDPILISSTVGIRKPAPQIFNLVLDHWGLPASACVMVGDTLSTDILGAQLAGLHSIWLVRDPARRGNVTPEAEIAALADLPKALDAW
jgi:HAD superfamily hydrolase (TIGR01549 family)